MDVLLPSHCHPEPVCEQVAMITPHYMLLLCTCLLGSGTAIAAADEPRPVHLARRAGFLPDAWYAQQTSLWQQRLSDRPGDPVGWYSLYLSLEYGQQRGQLSAVLTRMEQHVADSWQLPYLQARAEPNGPRKTELLQEALTRCTDCGQILEDLAMARELRSDRDAADSLWQRLYDSATLAPALLDYNHNLLHSVAADGILITGGDNDTFPAWMLQRACHVRPDVLILNLYLADADRQYLHRSLQGHGVQANAMQLSSLPTENRAAFLAELAALIGSTAAATPLYVALTVDAHSRQAVAQDLQLTGLAARINAPGAAVSAGELRVNLTRHFRLDALQRDWYAETHVSTRPVVRRLNGNYAYGMLALAQQLDTDQPAAAQHWRELAGRVARDSGDAHLAEIVQSHLERP